MSDKPQPEDPINPKYYTHPSGIECIEISKHLSGCLAQAFQYVWRCGQKDDPIQELKKAIWFIEAELTIDDFQLLSGEENPVFDLIDKVCHFETKYRHFALEFLAIGNTVDAKNRKANLMRATHAIKQLISEYESQSSTEAQ